MIAIEKSGPYILGSPLTSSLGILWVLYPRVGNMLAPCDWAPPTGRPKIGRPMPPHRQLS